MYSKIPRLRTTMVVNAASATTTASTEMMSQTRVLFDRFCVFVCIVEYVLRGPTEAVQTR